MVAATKQHTGKTSVSMAMLSGLRKIFGPDRVGYMKPVGQRHQIVEGGLKVSSFPGYAIMDHSAFPRASPVITYPPPGHDDDDKK